MKKATIRILLLTAVIFPTALKGQQSDTLHIDLPQALEIAISENPTVKVAGQEITKQEYAKKGVLAGLFPQLDFSANYNRTIQKQVMYMGGSGFGGSSENAEGKDQSKNQGIAVGRNNTWSTGFTASLPIISAPLWKQLSISADNVELAIEQSRSSKITLISQVKQAYYSVLLAKDSYRVFKQTYDKANEDYEDVKNKYAQGTVSEYDLIRAEVAVKNAEPDMLDAQNSIVLAKWKLKALMGIDLNTNIECAGSLYDYRDKIYADYFSADTTGVAGNSALRQLDIQRKQLKKTRDMNLAAYYPSLNFTFSYQWNAMSEDFKFSEYRWNPYSVLGLSLNIPIFSGGKRYSTVKQTKVQMMQLDLNRIETERNLMVSVKQYTNSMETSIKQYTAAEQGTKQARKGYDIAVKRYDTGAGTILEVNDSRLSLTQAEVNMNQAIYSFLTAKASLDETLGKESIDDTQL